MNRSTGRAISFLSLIALPAMAAATPADSPGQIEQAAALRQALDGAVETMFKPGELDPNWHKGGVDLEKAVRARPDHVLLEIDNEGERSIALYSDRPMAEFIPAEWELVAEIGTENRQANASEPIEISQLDHGYYVASRGPYEQVGDAFCSNIPTATRLYMVKGSRNEMSPEIASFIFREMLERARPYTVCARTDVVGDGYRSRYFLKDGRSLPFFDEQGGKVTIVPLRPTLELLRGE